jgi:hypothetical protein
MCLKPSFVSRLCCLYLISKTFYMFVDQRVSNENNEELVRCSAVATVQWSKLLNLAKRAQWDHTTDVCPSHSISTNVSFSDTLQKSFVTATTTRRKQQQQMVHRALLAEEDRRRAARENFRMLTVPVCQQASCEPALLHNAGEDHEEGMIQITNDSATEHRNCVAE